MTLCRSLGSLSLHLSLLQYWVRHLWQPWSPQTLSSIFSTPRSLHLSSSSLRRNLRQWAGTIRGFTLSFSLFSVVTVLCYLISSIFKVVLSYICIFCFWRGVVLSKKVNLVLVTLTWMEMEVCGLSFFFFHLATDFIVWIFATVFLYTNFNFLQNSIFHIATSFSILCHISIRNYFPKSQSAWLCVVVIQSLSCVRLFVTPWTVARQAPLSMGFPKQEYWSGFPFPSPYALSFDDPKFIKIVLYCMSCLRKFSLPQRS